MKTTCDKCSATALVKEPYAVYCAECWLEDHGRKQPKKTLSRVHTAKLCEEDVVLVRELLKDGNLSENQIAEKFEVSRNTINALARGRTWKHVS